MSGDDRIRAGLRSLAQAAEAATGLAPQVAALAERYIAVLGGGGTLYFAGNGGSAADAQHLATEYVVRFRQARRPLSAVALTTDTSLLTAAGNDLGFEQIFARQVEAHCRPGDLLILHSTSGASANLLAAARAARARGVPVAAFLGGDGGALRALADVAIVVPSDDTSRIQELQLALEHLIVEAVEEALGT
ncbi:MAG TPA: SIS domain-containing protein [Gemmatimonadales bacterium]|nr:SIS domain-containing protein [Gemmatimonadales bacterium]